MPTALIALSSLAIGGLVYASQDTYLGCAAGLFSFIIMIQLADIFRRLKK